MPFKILAQIFPKENDTLNYIVIGFQFPEVKKEKNYTIEIASGHFKDEASFKKNIIKTEVWTKNRGILHVPSFSKQYTWRVIPYSRVLSTARIHLNHFSTGYIYNPDTAVIRFNITHKADKFKDAYLMLDGNRTMYDMEGHLIWYLPDLGGIIKTKSQVRDIKISPRGTISFLVDGRAFETDYNGRILWEGPNGRKKTGDTLEGYHHELTILRNGHIMALGSDPFNKNVTKLQDSNKTKSIIDSSDRRPRRFKQPDMGILVEYDETGKLIWEWKAAKYFKNINLDFYNKFNGLPEFDLHENSFYFDEKNKAIYVSFRNISQILKISYPSGEVIAAYGRLEYATDSMEKHLFCGQHSCHLSENGYLYLYDNGCGIGHVPKVVVIKLPSSAMGPLEKIWEYPLPVEPAKADERPSITSVELNKRFLFTAGGNVTELPDQSFFISANVPFNKVLIVSKEQQILWSADMEKWHPDKKSWEPYSQYRISIIPDREHLENLIWKSIEN